MHSETVANLYTQFQWKGSGAYFLITCDIIKLDQPSRTNCVVGTSLSLRGFTFTWANNYVKD